MQAGTCHSLATAHELPFIIDLSLFLGRGLSSEPTEDGAWDKTSEGERMGDGDGQVECKESEGGEGGQDGGGDGGTSAEREDGKGNQGSVRVSVEGDQALVAGGACAGGGRGGGLGGGWVVESGGVLDAADNFLIGSAPYKYLMYWNRFLCELFFRDSSLPPQAQAAERGHKLYSKTCALPSLAAISRAKTMLASRQLASKVHVWFRALARMSGQEPDEPLHTQGYTPTSKKDLPFLWQHDLWDAAEPFRRQLDAKRSAEAARDTLRTLKASLAPTSSSSSSSSSRNASDVSRSALAPTSTVGGRRRRESLSGRSKLAAAQGFICPDVAAGADPDGLGASLAAMQEREDAKALRDRALEVTSGGDMRERRAVEEAVFDVGADDAEDMKRRASQRKVWDKKKKRFVGAERVSGMQGRLLRIHRQQEQTESQRERRQATGAGAGGGHAHGGSLYTKWKKENHLKIQAPGQTANERNAVAAASRAVVTLRNARWSPPAAAPTGGGGSAGRQAASASSAPPSDGGSRVAAAILAGPKRTTAALVRVETGQGHHKIGPSQGEGPRLKRERERRERAQWQRQRIALKKNKGQKPLPARLGEAMKQRVRGLEASAKGLRVGRALDEGTALMMQKRSMASSMKHMARHKGKGNPKKRE
jgi:hypothetical protein